MKQAPLFSLILLSSAHLIAETDCRECDSYSSYMESRRESGSTRKHSTKPSDLPSCRADEITPSAGPYLLGCEYHTFITADYLYWTIQQNDLQYWSLGRYEGDLTSDEPLNFPSPAKLESPDWNFRSGFRVGIGGFFKSDGWDTHAYYTWMRVRSTDRKIEVKENDLELTVGRHAGYLNSTANGDWKLDFNVVDLELGRNFYASCSLKLRPHFGLKGTWQKQSYFLDGVLLGSAPDGSGGFTEGTSLDTTDFKTDYWGIGIRGGCNSSWQISDCFGLYGNVALTALCESVESKIKRFSKKFDQLGHNIAFYKDSFDTIQPVLELGIGGRFDMWFCCDTYHFALDAGWEIQTWDDQNFMDSREINPKSGRTLFLQGLTLRTRFDF